MASQELRKIIDTIRARPLDPDIALEKFRADFEDRARALPPGPPCRSEPVVAGGVNAEWVDAPESDPEKVVLYLHGGGYVIGSLNTHRDLVSRIASAAGARALSADYRLAPEHPFPAAVDDAMAAYRWLLENGADPARVVIAGDSAGGGLAVATLVALRDAGDPLPAAGVCISPWVDMEGAGESMQSRAAEDPVLQREGLMKFARLYLNGADPRSPLAAPLYADLRGLPPMLIQVGTAETLLDDSTRLHAKAQGAGVDAELDVWEEMIHVWHFHAGLLPEAREAIGKIGEYIQARMT